jgi:hypothetical protein
MKGKRQGGQDERGVYIHHVIPGGRGLACIVVTKLMRVTTALLKEPKEDCPPGFTAMPSANLAYAEI